MPLPSLSQVSQAGSPIVVVLQGGASLRQVPSSEGSVVLHVLRNLQGNGHSQSDHQQSARQNPLIILQALTWLPYRTEHIDHYLIFQAAGTEKEELCIKSGTFIPDF